MSGPLGKPASRVWAQARAALIAYLIVFSLIAALPVPRNASAERLTRPFEREELRRWTELLNSIGFDVSADSVASGYVAFMQVYYRAREIALKPIEPWTSLTLTDQSWRLFATPDEDGYALSVTAHSAAGAEVLYESGHPARRWNAPLLEYRRIRANYSPSRRGPPQQYESLARRLGELVFASRPDVERVSVALLRQHIPLPGRDVSGRLGKAEPRHVIEIARPAP